jgi:ArsR family transcriptional regulator
VPAISKDVDGPDVDAPIDTCQYGDVKRLIDPDALLLQGAADPTRLAILRQLASGEGVCACDFTACCDVAQPTVSHHLKVLRESGWVRSERRGSNVWYWLRPEAVERFRGIAGELVAVQLPQPGRLLPVLQPRS